jgi:hypothetical protein
VCAEVRYILARDADARLAGTVCGGLGLKKHEDNIILLSAMK